MTTPDRTDPPLAADELATLLGFLDYQRATIRLKVTGLDAGQLAQVHAPSTMTLGGMVKHLALVEDWWGSCVLLGCEYAPPFDGVDWDADADWDWHSATDESPAELAALLDTFTAQTDANVRSVMADGSLDSLSVRPARAGGHFSLRWILCHLIEEYARHAGHADLIRESIDGATGE